MDLAARGPVSQYNSGASAGQVTPATILWPRGVGKSEDFILFSSPSIQYKQNSGLDKDRDGNVTKREAASVVRAKLVKGLGSGFLG